MPIFGARYLSRRALSLREQPSRETQSHREAQPVVDLSNSALPEAVLGDYNTPAGAIRRSDINGPITGVTVTSAPLITVDAHNGPVPGAQPNNVTALETGGTNFSSSVVRTASGNIWAVQTVQNPTVAGNDAIRFLDINAANNTVTQQGLISDPGFSFFYPSVAVNPSGQVVIGFGGTAAVTSDTLNTFVNAPAAPSASFNIVLACDQRSNVSMLATANDPTVNAFAYVNQRIVGSGNATLSVSLNGQGNTVLTYTGDNPVLPSYLFNYGGGPGSPHFGFDGAQGATVISQYWSTVPSDDQGSQLFRPVLSVLGPALTPPNGGNGGTDGGTAPGEDGKGDVTKVEGPVTPFGLVSFATLFTDITAGGLTTGLWDEVAFDTGTHPTLILTNPTDFAETLSDAGYLISATHIPLDQLNFGGEPPPGFPGSMFTLLNELDGTTLCPGCTVDLTLPAPESSTWAMLMLGFAGIGFAGYRASRKTAALAGLGAVSFP